MAKAVRNTLLCSCVLAFQERLRVNALPVVNRDFLFSGSWQLRAEGRRNGLATEHGTDKVTLLLPEEERVAAELGKHPEAGTRHGVAAPNVGDIFWTSYADVCSWRNNGKI